jgi:hypothetical protein
MCCVRFTMSSSHRKAVEHQRKTAQHLGSCARSSISSPHLTTTQQAALAILIDEGQSRRGSAAPAGVRP